MHSTDTLAALNLAFSERFGLGPDTPIFMASPLGHSVGTYHGVRLAMWNGAPLVLQRRWDPEAALGIIDREGCAFTAAATPFLKDLLDAPWSGTRPKLAPMTSFLCGGAQVPPALMEQAAEIFPQTFVTVLWGMTEGGLTTCVPESPHDKLLTTAGFGLPGLEVCALDDQERALSAGEEGELAMRGPGVFIGYCGQDDFYRSLLTETGFFRTGDLARIDGDGYVQITGRLKDLIVRGGVNISPVPIEDAIAAHPAVKSVAVIGHPDERLGERICAVIVAADPAPGTDEIIEFVKSHGLSKAYWPEHVRRIDAMPATPAGKIRKNDLRAWLESQIATEGAPQ
jgi:acyl-CoA synthetase (AMP-forming)/AMP-acid ligase II